MTTFSTLPLVSSESSSTIAYAERQMTPVAEVDRHLTPTLRIRPTKGWAALNLGSLSFLALLNCGVMLVMLFLFIADYRVPPTLRLAAIRVFLFLTAMAATGVALWFSALSVKYRDCNYALPFFLQIWMYASAVVYPTSMIVSPRWQTLFALNPVVGFVEGFRWSVLGRSALNPTIFWVTVAMSLFILVSGAFFFRRVERSFADII